MGSLSEEFKSRADEYELQRAKFEALRNTLGNYGNFRYVNFYDFLDPNNQNWNDYTYSQHFLTGSKHGRVGAGTPVGMLIQRIRDAKNIDDVKKQLGIWNTYKPLDSSDNGTNYLRYFLGPRFAAYLNTPSNESNPGQTGNTGGTQGAQGVVTVGSTQGTQGAVAGSGTQGVQGAQAGNTGGGAASTQGAQVGAQTGGTGGTTGNGKPRMSDDEIDAFLKEELGGNTTGGTYASFGVPKGETKTIGYENEQERRAALIDKWNQEHGISYFTGKDGVIYRKDPQHLNGYVDPFKNDLSTWTRATYASPGINTGGTYATGEGIKDANGNVLTNPGGDWEYQYALKNPQYGLGMMGKMSDAQKNYLQAVSNDMGYKYNFTGAPRFV